MNQGKFVSHSWLSFFPSGYMTQRQKSMTVLNTSGNKSRNSRTFEEIAYHLISMMYIPVKLSTLFRDKLTNISSMEICRFLSAS